MSGQLVDDPATARSSGRSADQDCNPEVQRPSSDLIRRLLVFCDQHLAALFMAALLVVYAYFFYQVISPYWFHPKWTSDDALQQLFPFHKIEHPELFRGDLITTMIEGYLTPIHYALSYVFTILTGSPIMMGHWLMLLQMVSALVFLFLAVRQAAGVVPALFATTWMLHTRHVMQRLTAGLPRGWSLVVFCAYLYFVLCGSHWGVLLTILVGFLLHPPGTAVVGLSYGFYLLWMVARKETRAANIPHLKRLILVTPVYFIIALSILHRPEEIGPMVTYDQAMAMPEFQRPLGRFPFVPLRPAWEEIKSFGFQSFTSRFYAPGMYIKPAMPAIGIGLLLTILLCGRLRRRISIPAPVVCYLLGAVGLYFAARALAFKLYVPDRHLQIPFAVFSVVGLTIGVWRVLCRSTTTDGAGEGNRYPDLPVSRSWPGLIGLFALGGFIALAGGAGLNGAMNFNFASDKKGHAWQWMQTSTPVNALIAGHPTHLDSVFLFGKRQGFVTTETAHPFYPKYNAEMKRRLEISLRAHFAASLQEVVDILTPHGIGYFVFERKQFYPDELQKATYFPPLDVLTRSLTSRPADQYAFRQLPATVNLEKYPFMPFKDKFSVVIDVQKLKTWLESHPSATVNEKGIVHDAT